MRGPYSNLIFIPSRRTSGGAVLDPDDLIKDVLDDNDFVIVGNYYLTLNVTQTQFNLPNRNLT